MPSTLGHALKSVIVISCSSAPQWLGRPAVGPAVGVRFISGIFDSAHLDARLRYRYVRSAADVYKSLVESVTEYFCMVASMRERTIPFSLCLHKLQFTHHFKKPKGSNICLVTSTFGITVNVIFFFRWSCPKSKNRSFTLELAVIQWAKPNMAQTQWLQKLA